ncbi:hypothetical protein BDZ94DRAFT_1258934 [Collybia nuda]|uniref:Uncharacterized protein n=1 Tax=Collybia nuda TaxID=64659 RepID=A0A9P5Y841_9AGAR|nr:hypothetical protein BDZ94DRAFT_1258934 [Collybia nuda]
MRFLGGVAISVVVLGVFAILVLCIYWDRHRARKARDGELGDDRESGAHIESVPLLNSSPRRWSRFSLRPLRRKDNTTRRGREPEHDGPTPQHTPISRDPEFQALVLHTGESGGEPAQQIISTSTETRLEAHALNLRTGSLPPRLSIVIPDASRRGQFSALRPDPMDYTPPPAYQPISSAGDRASQSPLATPGSIRPASARLIFQSEPQHTFSDSTWVPSSSYPGTTRGISPPAYSALSGRAWVRSSEMPNSTTLV